MASSVERGCKKTNPKHKKTHISKQKKTFTERKNRAQGDIAKMCLLCLCEQDCLMKHGQPPETPFMIQQLTKRLFQKDYNKQNYIPARQIEFKFAPVVWGGLPTRYHVSEKFVEALFKNVMEFPRTKSVILKKMDVDGVPIQADMRGRHEHRTTKLLPEVRNMVIDYICS